MPCVCEIPVRATEQHRAGCGVRGADGPTAGSREVALHRPRRDATRARCRRAPGRIESTKTGRNPSKRTFRALPSFKSQPDFLPMNFLIGQPEREDAGFGKLLGNPLVRVVDERQALVPVPTCVTPCRLRQEGVRRRGRLMVAGGLPRRVNAASGSLARNASIRSAAAVGLNARHAASFASRPNRLGRNDRSCAWRSFCGRPSRRPPQVREQCRGNLDHAESGGDQHFAASPPRRRRVENTHAQAAQQCKRQEGEQQAVH